jgi:hypothetical protein
VVYISTVVYMSSFFLSIVASIMVLKDSGIRGIRQGNIRHAPKTRNIASIQVLNPPTVENQPPDRSLGLHPFRSAQGHGQAFSSCQ